MIGKKEVNELASLRAELAMETQRHADQYTDAKEWRRLAETHEKALKETREQFADLKRRLLEAENTNQFMRGYIARLQEDDVVREELVVTGDPGGETQMVPKRKHVRLAAPDDYTQFKSQDDLHKALTLHRDPKPKHWVTY